MCLLFSEQMFSHSNKTSTATVASKTKNVQSENGAFRLGESTCGQIENMLDKLLNKDKARDVDFKQKSDLRNSKLYQNNEIKYDDDSYTDNSEDWTDISESEIEYPVEFLMSKQQKSKNAENTDSSVRIIDVPQFILVFTALKAEDTVIIPPNDLLPEYIQAGSECATKKCSDFKLPNEKLKSRDIIKQHKALINRKSSQKATPSNSDKKVPKLVHRINYVRYPSSMNAVQREREVQVTEYERVTNEASVQCDLDEEEEIKAATEDSSQLEWINHIIEAHVLNDDDDIYECHICGEIALSYASKERHSLIHKESSLLCFKCGLHFRTADKLKSHEKTMHQGNVCEIKKALRCPKLYCTKAFHSKKQLFKHIDGHAKKTEQRCSKCQRSFISLFQYHIHKSKRNCWR